MSEYPPLVGHAHTCSCDDAECKWLGCRVLRTCPICHPPFNLDEQTAAAARELALRKQVYKKWLAKGTMKQADAQREVGLMEAIVKTLRDLAGPRDEIPH